MHRGLFQHWERDGDSETPSGPSLDQWGRGSRRGGGGGGRGGGGMRLILRMWRFRGELRVYL